MARHRRLILRALAIALLFGLGFWLVDSIAHLVYFGQNLRHMMFEPPETLLDALALKLSVHTLFVRFSFLATCLLGGLVSARFIARQRETEQEHQTYVDSAPVGVFVVDGEGRPVEVNPAACAMTQLSRSELLSLSLGDLAAAEDMPTIRGWIEQVKRTGQMRIDTAARRRDGTVFHLHLDAVALPNGHLMAFVQDTTARVTLEEQRRQAEEELQQYADQLEDMVEERTRELQEAQDLLLRQERLAVLGQLAGSIAHELRTPLGTVKNATYLLNMILPDPDSTVQEILDIVDLQVSTSDQIITNLLDFARTRQPAKQFVDVNLALNEALSRVDVPAQVCVTSNPAELPPISADPAQLGQILDNLIRNAIQAMPEGGQLTLTTTSLQPMWVAISIEDTGVGIPNDDMSRLFEPLFTTKVKGIGLGLALVKMLVDAHGGRVEVDSCVGEGSTFTVHLPVDTDGEGPDRD